MEEKIFQLEQELIETKNIILELSRRLEAHDRYINLGLDLWEKIKLHPLLKPFIN